MRHVVCRLDRWLKRSEVLLVHLLLHLLKHLLHPPQLQRQKGGGGVNNKREGVEGDKEGLT